MFPLSSFFSLDLQYRDLVEKALQTCEGNYSRYVKNLEKKTGEAANRIQFDRYAQSCFDLYYPRELHSQIIDLTSKISRFFGRESCGRLVKKILALQEPLGPFLMQMSDPKCYSVIMRVRDLFSLFQERKRMGEGQCDQTMHRSKKWISAALQMAVVGVTRCAEKKLSLAHLTTDGLKDTVLKGVHKHTEISIGSSIEEYVFERRHQQMDLLLQQLHAHPDYLQLVEKIKSNKAGYERYMEGINVQQVMLWLDQYLVGQIALQKVADLERLLIEVFHTKLVDHPKGELIELLSTLYEGPDAVHRCNLELDEGTRKSLLKIADFYFFAAVKCEGCFYDEIDEVSERTAISVLWMDLVREMLINGLLFEEENEDIAFDTSKEERNCRKAMTLSELATRRFTSPLPFQLPK